MKSLKHWLTESASSPDIKKHDNFKANGTCPHSCAILRQSWVLALGSNSRTSSWEELISSGPILTDWWPSKRTFMYSKDSLVVTRNFTLLFRLRISSRRWMTCSFTSGAPTLSSNSSALSRIRSEGPEISAKRLQSSSSSDRRWDGWLFVTECFRKLRSFDVRSTFDCSPRNETK